MIGQRHELARLQSIFYRDYYYKALRWVYVEIFIMFILITAIIYHIVVHPVQHFYASTLEGRILTLHPGKLGQ
jgi:hypothetical protein